MHLVEVLLPLNDNEGRPFDSKKFSALREVLTERFCISRDLALSRFSSLGRAIAHIRMVALRFWPSFGSCPVNLALTNSKAVTAALAGPSHNSAMEGSIRSKLTSGLPGPSGHQTSSVFRQTACIF
jgi:hypothetical protein